ncbi:MAG: hypothetical protein ACD_10C00625G0001 [uncultured bacterium]|nr:MAG: hypothetical protein ACD_10C00625G0001 [uncultured bacterium]
MIDQIILDDPLPPRFGHEVRGHLQAAHRAVFHLFQVLQRFEYGLPARHGTKINAAREVRQEPANSLVLIEQFLEIGIFRRPSERVDLSHCGFQQGCGDGGEDRVSEIGVADLFIDHDGAGRIQGQSCGIEITQPAQPRGSTLLGGVRPYFCDNHVEEVEDIVLGACFERPNERQQGGGSTLVRHSGDRLRFGGIGKPREREDARLRQLIGSRQPRGELPYFVETFDRPREFGRALKRWSRSEPVHRTLPRILGNDCQGVQTLLLICRDPRRQQAPKATIRAAAHAGDHPFQHARAGQQNLVRHQPGRGLIE